MIQTFDIAFDSRGEALAGRLFRPAAPATRRQPVIAVTGSWLTVKEQMAEVYARRLAEAGFTAFTFDFSGFGLSHGTPRQCEMPARKIEDIKAAVTFLRTMSFVSGVGYLAICASAQYAVAAVAAGAQIDAFVSVAGWFHDLESVGLFYGAREGVAQRLARAHKATVKYLATGDQSLVPAYAEADERAGMFFPMEYYASPQRGAIAAWKNQMDEMSWAHWLNFDGVAAAGSVATPTLLVHSDGCALPDNARRVHSLLGGPKELEWLDAGGQTDFYDRTEFVDRATKSAASWFRRFAGAEVAATA